MAAGDPSMKAGVIFGGIGFCVAVIALIVATVGSRRKNKAIQNGALAVADICLAALMIALRITWWVPLLAFVLAAYHIFEAFRGRPTNR
jgi:Ca2+/Na+ antiporter